VSNKISMSDEMSVMMVFTELLLETVSFRAASET